jgi:DeoR/GlpR family transcriptional regulator of sugar metabolism
MLKYSRWQCVLADGSKIGKAATVRYAALNEVDLLVTDDSAATEKLEKLKDAVPSVEVVHASDRKGEMEDN